MTSYAVVLPVDENRMSANTLRLIILNEVSEVRWTISVKCLESQSGKLEPNTPYNQ